MEVNGLPLPAALEQIVRDGQGEWTAWLTSERVKRERKDAYGNHFDRFDPEFFNPETMIEVTSTLPGRCRPQSEEVLQILAGKPGLIPYVKDFSKIVAFAELVNGEPFCLDYRENDRDPEVILYQDGYWRQVAPNFTAFMELLEPSSGRPGRRPLEVNGLPLPAALAQIVRDARGEWTPWCFKEKTEPVNAYGDEFDASIETSSLERMIEETAALPHRFDLVDEEESNRQAEVPGFLPYIGDYSQIVVFGSTGSGDPFCLDYRDNPQEPRVIFFQDGYWQRVAPNFAAFWELLEPDP